MCQCRFSYHGSSCAEAPTRRRALRLIASAVLAPSLAGSGSRWSEGQLRLRLVDASSLNPATIMPSYYRVDGLARVGSTWRGKPILSAEQIEDMVAYLVTLRE